MRYLLLSSYLLLMLASCNTAYKNLATANGNINQLLQLKPSFTTTLYSTQVDVIGSHLSGLLLIKKMPDSSIRIVFSSEMGFSFFDFEFTPDANFKVRSIIQQMNKKAVIKTLRKDFEIILMQQLMFNNMQVKQDELHRLYYIFRQQKGSNCYITDSNTATLIRMERASANRPVVEILTYNYNDGIPDSINISHKNFTFNIQLKKINRNNVTQ